jgi:predicted RNA-binding Zn ribbon-like protein
MRAVSLDDLPRVGGDLCLDYVNTVDTWQRTDRIDYLSDYRALVVWAARAGALPTSQAERLLDGAATRQPQANRVHVRAVALRDALFHVLAPGTRGLAEPWLEIVNEELECSLRRLRLRPAQNGYELASTTGDELDQMLWPVLRAATKLATSPDLERVRSCPGQDCGWLFLDTSKAGRRRWCSMAICGNRIKTKRHRARARLATTA